MKPRVLGLPTVEMSDHPENVTIKIVTDAEAYDYLRVTLSPKEARRFAAEILSDSIRAEYCRDREEWLAKR